MDWPADLERIGPLPVTAGPAGSRASPTSGGSQAEQPAQVLLKGPASTGPATTRTLLEMRRARSARRDTAAVAVRVGVADLG